MSSEIERLAKEAELADEFGRPLPAYPRRLAKFAALVVEACAKECESVSTFDYFDPVAGFAGLIRAKFAQSHGEDAAK